MADAEFPYGNNFTFLTANAALPMSAFRGKADMAIALRNVR